MRASGAQFTELLQLYLATGMDGPTLLSVYGQFGSLAALARATDRQWAALNASPAQRAALLAASSDTVAAQTESALNWAEQPGRRIISYGSATYPSLLASIPDPPLFLFLEGSCPGLLDTLQVAVVGARKASAQARQFADVLCSQMAGASLVLTSGMAYGVDACVHRAALDQGRATIAVHGCGLNHCYPAAHAGLRAAIAANGLHVSEFGPDERPRKHYFPRRNRIISGLSKLLIVIEAGERSGSLSTARHALAQGRDVLVAPGPAGSRQCLGSNRLLRDGAGVVLELADVLALLPEPAALADQQPAEPPSPPVSKDARALLEQLCSSMQDADTVIARSGMGAPRVMTALTELELAGLLVREGSMIGRI